MTDVRLGYDNEETSLIDYRFNDYSDNATKIRVAEEETKKAQAEAEKAQAENKNIEIRDKYTATLMDEQSNPEQKRIAQEFLQSLNPSQDSWTEFFYGLGCFIFSFIFIA